MNLEFMEIEKKDVVKSEGIFIGGEHVGRVDVSDRITGCFRYHAMIDIDGFPGGLVQGHGDSNEEAVLNAIRDNRATAISRLEALEQLQRDLLSPVNLHEDVA